MNFKIILVAIKIFRLKGRVANHTLHLMTGLFVSAVSRTLSWSLTLLLLLCTWNSLEMIFTENLFTYSKTKIYSIYWEPMHNVVLINVSSCLHNNTWVDVTLLCLVSCRKVIIFIAVIWINWYYMSPSALLEYFCAMFSVILLFDKPFS